MKTRWLPVVAVAVLAGAVVAYRQLHRDLRQAASRAGPEMTGTSGPSVLLFADPREADGADPCAEIFRIVRRAGARGLRVREFAPGEASEAARKYRVTIEPTVLVLDTNGRVIARHEGESPVTIAAIGSSLDRLLARR